MPLNPHFRDLYAKGGISPATAPRIFGEAQKLHYVEQTERFQTPNVSAKGVAFVVLTCHGLTKGSDAAKGAVDFASSEYMCTPGEEEQKPRLGDRFVLDGIAKMVVGGAREVVALETGAFEQVRDLRFGPDRSLPHEVRLCLNPLTVAFYWPPLNGRSGQTDVYAHFRSHPAFPGLEQGLIERWATLPWAFFVAAGRAWLEIQRQHGTDPSLPLSDPSSARGGNENAETLPGASAHARTHRNQNCKQTRDQDRTTDPGPLPTPEPKAGAEGAQAGMAVELGHTPFPPGGLTDVERDFCRA